MSFKAPIGIGRHANPGPRQSLNSLLDSVIDADRPDDAIAAHRPVPPAGRSVVIGAGKVAAAMVAGIHRVRQGPLEGIVVARYGRAVRARLFAQTQCLVVTGSKRTNANDFRALLIGG